jgi:hypothetical protein
MFKQSNIVRVFTLTSYMFSIDEVLDPPPRLQSTVYPSPLLPSEEHLSQSPHLLPVNTPLPFQQALQNINIGLYLPPHSLTHFSPIFVQL